LVRIVEVAALLRNKLPFWSSHPTRGHFGAQFRKTLPARLKLASSMKASSFITG
jgi:hypothetical protein